VKLDQYYSAVMVCPVTRRGLTHEDVHRTLGVCPHCGHASGSTITHYLTVAGRWKRPTFLERLRGARPQFIEKPDDD
jgi:hypothetical protein